MTDGYKENSPGKDFVREKWVAYTKESINNPTEGLSLFTLTTPEMEDVKLFVNNGLLEWSKKETESYEITKGRLYICESNGDRCRKINDVLVNAKVWSDDVGHFLFNFYSQLFKGDRKMFPLDMINLDFDGCLAKNKVGIEKMTEIIFDCQSKHRVKFSFFLTFPEIERCDLEETEYMDMLNGLLEENLKNEFTIKFQEDFKDKYKTVKDLTHGQFLVVCVAKLIVKNATAKGYKIVENDFIQYTGGGDTPMISMLFRFEHTGQARPDHGLYFNEVPKTLKEIDII